MEVKDYFEDSSRGEERDDIEGQSVTVIQPFSPQNAQIKLDFSLQRGLLDQSLNSSSMPMESQRAFKRVNTQKVDDRYKNSNELPPIDFKKVHDNNSIKSISVSESPNTKILAKDLVPSNRVSQKSVKKSLLNDFENQSIEKCDLNQIKKSSRYAHSQHKQIDQEHTKRSYEGELRLPPIEQTIEMSEKQIVVQPIKNELRRPLETPQTVAPSPTPTGGLSLFDKMMKKNQQSADADAPEQNKMPEEVEAEKEKGKDEDLESDGKVEEVGFSENFLKQDIIDVVQNQNQKKKKNLVKDFTEFFSKHDEKEKPCGIILSDDPFKVMWDIFVLLILVVTTAVVPYRLAFVDEEPLSWVITYYFFDLTFLTDLILSFFTSYHDDVKHIDVTSHKLIALNYVKGWFLLDFLSIVPFDAFLSGQANLNTLVRVSRVGKMYKIVRILRLVKVMKMLRQHRKLVHNFAANLKISQGSERLGFFTFMFCVLLHVFACLFIMLAEMEKDFSDVLWIDKCTAFGEDTQDIETYVCSAYFVLTTMATVGYGDISPQTTLERIFGCVLMVVGVVSFTFVSGALASILSNFDTQEAGLQEKVFQLNKLRSLYPVSDKLVEDLRNALNFDNNKTEKFLDELYMDLPVGLKMELQMVVYETTFQKFSFFKDLGNRLFVTWVSQQLKPYQTTPTQRLYSEGDEIHEYYFMTKGVAAFISEKQDNAIIGVADPLKVLAMNAKASNLKVFQSFGCEDSIYNHLNMLIQVDKGHQAEIQKQAENALNTRRFTVECISQAEYLTLNYQTLDKMKKNFQAPSRKFFKFMIDQFKQLMTYTAYCVQKFSEKMKNPQYLKMLQQNHNKKRNYMKESADRLNKFTQGWNKRKEDDSDVMSTLNWSSSESEQDDEPSPPAIMVQPAGDQYHPDKDDQSVGFVLQGTDGNQPVSSVSPIQGNSSNFEAQFRPAVQKMINRNRQGSSNRLQEKFKPIVQNMISRKKAGYNIMNPANMKKNKKTKVSKEAMKKIEEARSNLSGHLALANILKIAVEDKKKSKSLAEMIKAQIQAKLEEANYELEILRNLPEKKLQLLENLIAEQDFRISLNSMNSNERALNEFCMRQEELIMHMTERFEHKVEEMREELYYKVEMINAQLQNKQ